MKIVKLSKCEYPKTKKNDPGLPAIELVLAVYDCSHKEFHCRLGDKEGVSRQYSTNTTVCHTPNKTHRRTVAIPWIKILQRPYSGNDC